MASFFLKGSALGFFASGLQVIFILNSFAAVFLDIKKVSFFQLGTLGCRNVLVSAKKTPFEISVFSTMSYGGVLCWKPIYTNFCRIQI